MSEGLVLLRPCITEVEMAELLELDRAIFGKHAYDEDDIRGFYKNPYFSP